MAPVHESIIIRLGQSIKMSRIIALKAINMAISTSRRVLPNTENLSARVPILSSTSADIKWEFFTRVCIKLYEACLCFRFCCHRFYDLICQLLCEWLQNGHSKSNGDRINMISSDRCCSAAQKLHDLCSFHCVSITDEAIKCIRYCH